MAATTHEASPVEIRAATVQDVPRMANIINGFAAHGIMLPRSHYQFYQHIQQFVVAEAQGEVIGCGALSVVWSDLSEIRSVAVDAGWQGLGVGRMIVEALLQRAAELGLPGVFTLTYQPDFFQRFGFYRVAHETLPHKIWGDCLNCPKYPDCDEVAMKLELVKESEHAQG
ncbi:MAG: N-acetyltransferase [Anaerolineae bacterium]|jgi:amino-acid N-acetyltransferase